MRNIASFISDNPIYGWIIILVCVAGGWHGINNIGRLEDPPFPTKVQNRDQATKCTIQQGVLLQDLSKFLYLGILDIKMNYKAKCT